MELVLIVEINHIQSSMNLLDLNAPILGYDTVYGTCTAVEPIGC